MPVADPPEALLRLPAVEAMTGQARTTIYRKVAAGTFPAPRRIGDRSVAWLQSEVLAWMRALPSTREPTPPQSGTQTGTRCETPRRNLAH